MFRNTCIVVSMSMEIVAFAKDFQIFSIAQLRTEPPSEGASERAREREKETQIELAN